MKIFFRLSSHLENRGPRVCGPELAFRSQVIWIHVAKKGETRYLLLFLVNAQLLFLGYLGLLFCTQKQSFGPTTTTTTTMLLCHDDEEPFCSLR